MTRSFRILLAASAAAFAFVGASSASAGSITLSDPNCASFTVSGPAGNQTLACVTGGGGPNAPTGCVTSMVTSPTTLTNAGGTATVSVYGCSATGVLTYNWSRNGQPNWSTSASPTADTLGSGGTAGYTNSYQVQVCNDGSSCVSVPSIPLTAFVPGTGGGGGGVDFSACTAQGLTGHLLDLGYSTKNNVRLLSTSAQPAGFGDADAMVVRFTTPNVASDTSSIQINPGTYSNRMATLSTSPCVVATSSTPGGNVIAVAPPSQTPVMRFIIGGTARGSVTLQPATTYYLTVVNRDDFSGAKSCTSYSCDFTLDFNN